MMTSIRNFGAKIILGASLCTATIAAADESNPRPNLPQVRLKDTGSGEAILNDPYVKLYLARLQRAKIVIEKAKQELALSVKHRSRAEVLHEKNALSSEELEIARRDVEVHSLSVQEAEASADEAEIFVDIALSRISIGLEMPICAEIR
jgi:hypothetical protein